jgi:hypothetical protein
MDSDLYVAKAGDTMTGALTIPNGSLTGHAVNKGQMDTADATLNTAIGLRVLKAGDTMTGALTIPNGTLTGHAVNKGQMDTADAALNTALTTADGLRVLKAGDTMTGNLTIPTGTAVGHAVTKAQMDTADGLRVAKTGDTMSGSLSVTGAISATTTITATGNITGNQIHANDWFRSNGNNGWYSTTHGGGIYMTDSTWVRVYNGKAFLVPNTIAGSYLTVNNSESNSLFGNTWRHAINDGANGVGAALGVYGQAHFRRPNSATGTSTGWSTRGLILSSQTGQVDDSAGLALWVDNIAPILGAHSGTGEKFQCLNNSVSTAGGGPYVPILASAFTTASSLRFKMDVTRPEDDELLGKVKQVSGIKFRRLGRPPMMHPNARFQEVDTAWQAKGHSPLTRQPKHMEPGEHDCAVADCIGTADDPCCIILNDTDRYGLAAEDLYEIIPEVVELGVDRLPLGYDVDQVAALALTTVGALTRKVEALEARLAELEVA